MHWRNVVCKMPAILFRSQEYGTLSPECQSCELLPLGYLRAHLSKSLNPSAWWLILLFAFATQHNHKIWKTNISGTPHSLDLPLNTSHPCEMIIWWFDLIGITVAYTIILVLYWKLRTSSTTLLSVWKRHNSNTSISHTKLNNQNKIESNKKPWHFFNKMLWFKYWLKL